MLCKQTLWTRPLKNSFQLPMYLGKRRLSQRLRIISLAVCPLFLCLMLHNYMTVMWPMAIVARMLFVRSSACQLWQKELTLLVILAFVGRSPRRPKLQRRRTRSKPQQSLWRRPRLTLLICLWHHGVENFISKLLLKSTLANLHCPSSSLSPNLYLSGPSSTRDG